MMHDRKEGGPHRRQVREPVQVYLDERDRALLEAIAARSALSRAEILRLGLRRIAAEVLAEGRPGASLSSLVGALDNAANIPADLSERHDNYLYGEPRDE